MGLRCLVRKSMPMENPQRYKFPKLLTTLAPEVYGGGGRKGGDCLVTHIHVYQLTKYCIPKILLVFLALENYFSGLSLIYL
jgi:hypothetical protein